MRYYMWTATGMQETGERLWGDYVVRREAESRIAELEKALQTAIEELESETCSACNDLRTVLKPKENE